MLRGLGLQTTKCPGLIGYSVPEGSVRFKSHSNACKPQFFHPSTQPLNLKLADPARIIAGKKPLQCSPTQADAKEGRASVLLVIFPAPAENRHIRLSWFSPCLTQTFIRSVTCSSPFQRIRRWKRQTQSSSLLAHATGTAASRQSTHPWAATPFLYCLP